MTKKWIAEAIYGIMVILFMGVSIGIGKKQILAEERSNIKISGTPTGTSEVKNS